MSKFMSYLAVALSWPLLATLPLGAATTNAAPASAPVATTNAAAATTPIALADIVSQADMTQTQLQSDQTTLSGDQTATGIDAGLPAITKQIDDQIRENADMLSNQPTLVTLQSAQASWQALANNLSSSQKDLSDDAQQVANMLTRLGQWQAKWQDTLADSQKAGAPAEIIQRIQTVLGAIDATSKSAQAVQAQILAVQGRVAEQNARVSTALNSISKAQSEAINQLFVQNRPQLWNLQAGSESIVSEEKYSLASQFDGLKIYLSQKLPAVIIQGLILILLIGAFTWLRTAIHAEMEKQATLARAVHAFDLPIMTAILVTLLTSSFLYPIAPRLLWTIIGLAAIFPTLAIIRRLIAPTFFPVLYATVIAYLVDLLRNILLPTGLTSRFLFLGELIAACLFLLYALHAMHLAPTRKERTRAERIVRLYFHVSVYLFVFAGLANVFGYEAMGNQVGDGVLKASYLALVVYAAVRIADALVIAALNLPPLTRFRMVHRHSELLYANLSIGIRWLSIIFWGIAALQIFSIRDPLYQAASSVLTAQHHWGSMTFQIGPILAFPITVWAAFLLSRFIRFALEEEVYPNLNLARGIPYAASTVVHYTVLVLGFFIAAKAAGFDLTQFSFLAGAFGVGLGFGLQNIFNNFVSGIILLFERPIKVGDQVQTDLANANMAGVVGTVRSIGIRASIIRLNNGSELIVPNGNLISNPVLNWTLSNSDRLIEIPVNVSAKADPRHVMDLLTGVAMADTRILHNPAPQTLLATMSATAMTLRVRIWVDADEDPLKVTSDLSLAMTAALARENIALT